MRRLALGARPLAVVLFVASAAMGTACSLGLSFDGISEGTTGTKIGDFGSGEDIGSRDASPPPPDAFQEIPEDDSGLPPPIDGSSDAGPDAPLPPVGFCASFELPPTFCADFEAGTLAGWTSTRTENGGIVVNNAASVSNPFSALSSTNTLGAGAGVGAVVRKTFPAFDKKPIAADYSFEMRIEAFDGSKAAVIGDFAFTAGNSYSEIQLVGIPSNGKVSLWVAEYSSPSTGYREYPLGVSLVANQWITLHYQLTVKTLGGTNQNSIRVFIDDVQKLNTALQVPIYSGLPSVELGVGWVDAPASPWKVRYDNLALTATSP